MGYKFPFPPAPGFRGNEENRQVLVQPGNETLHGKYCL